MSFVWWWLLQAPEYSHLKVALLQDSFIQDLWKKLGKQTYIEKIHPLVISNLCSSPNKIIASAASTVLIVSSEELGIPITIHQASLSRKFYWYTIIILCITDGCLHFLQTILPLIHCFGKGLGADGIDTLVRIGNHLMLSRYVEIICEVITS